MNKPTLALALIASTALACTAAPIEEDADEAAGQLAAAAKLPQDSGCLVTEKEGAQTKRFKRVLFREGQHGPFAFVETYDAETGFAGAHEFYQYKRLENGDVVLFEARTGMNLQKAFLRFDGESSVWEEIHEHDHVSREIPSDPLPRISAKHAATCDLNAKSPTLALPIAQKTGTPKVVPQIFPVTFGGTGDDGSCVGTQLVRGQVLRVVTHGKRRDDDFFFRVELYDPTTHFLAEDLIEDKNEPSWSFGGGDYTISSKRNDDFITHARMEKTDVAGKQQFVLKPVELFGLTSDVPMSCDFTP